MSGQPTRRSLLAQAAALGAALAFGRSCAHATTGLAHRTARPLPAGRGLRRSRARQRDPVDAPRAGCRRKRAPADGGGRQRRSLRPRRRARRCGGQRRDRLDLPLPRRRPQARARILVSLRRRGRKHEPRRPHAHRACRKRRPARALRLRQLPGRHQRRAQRLPAHDLRGRAAPARGTAQLRAAPRRLHLRDRPLSRRYAGRPGSRPASLPALCAIRTARRCATSTSPPISTTIAPRTAAILTRSRSAGCARALAVRARVGQSRILVERLSEPAGHRSTIRRGRRRR